MIYKNYLCIVNARKVQINIRYGIEFIYKKNSVKCHKVAD